MQETTLNRMFLNRIEAGGDSVRYLVPSDGRWTPMTYRQVGDAVRETANGLMSLGLAKGDRVAILCSTRVEWCLADIACIVGGYPTVPIYPASLSEQVEYVLANSGARAVFVEDQGQRDKVSAVARNLPGLSAVILMTGEPPAGDDAISVTALRARGAAFAAANPGALAARTEEIGPDDVLTIIYTSGTTGPPKGVVHLHRNFAFLVGSGREAVAVKGGEVFLQLLPLAHVLGRYEHFMTFDAMAVSAFARSIQTVGEDLALVKPEIMISVPRLYEKLYARVLAKVEEEGGLKKAIFHWALGVGREVSRRRQRGEPVDGVLAWKFSVADRLVFGKIRERLGGRLRFSISGGAPLSPEVAEFLHALGVLVLEGYGLTENGGPASVNRIEKYKFGTVGKALPGTEIRIAPDGEILIRGPHVFQGYLNDPEATREAIDSDGWFHSGDIGVMDADGFVKITDRKKDIIVTSGGKNIAPQNIENLLKTDPLVSQAFVYGDRRKYLTALITLSPEEIVRWARENGLSETDPALLAKHPRVEQLMRARIDALNRRLASFEQIKKFVLLGSDFTQEGGELTPTLKLKRKVVLERYGTLLDALYESD